MMRALNEANQCFLRRVVAMTVGVACLVGCDGADESVPSTTIDESERCLGLAEGEGIDGNLMIATRNDDPPELICAFVDNRTGRFINVIESPDGVVTTALPDQESSVDG
jgi:hypothetical protein